jgi:tryptophanyl-tRNA synthetase
VLSDFGGQQFSAFKKSLAELAAHKVGPIAAESAKLMADPAHIDAVLADGARRARTIASPVMNQVKDIVGFIRG